MQTIITLTDIWPILFKLVKSETFQRSILILNNYDNSIYERNQYSSKLSNTHCHKPSWILSPRRRSIYQSRKYSLSHTHLVLHTRINYLAKRPWNYSLRINCNRPSDTRNTHPLFHNTYTQLVHKLFMGFL